MKSTFSVTSRNYKGYTLVELLVVMAIIGTLAGISVPLVNGFLKKGRVSNAKVVISSLQRGYTDYYNDYNRYPSSRNPSSRGGGVGLDEDGVPFDSQEGTEIAAVGMGLDEEQNPKKKNYLSSLPSTDKRSMRGLYYNNQPNSPDITIISPWGKPYFIQFDQNYDGEINPTILRSNKVINDTPIVLWTHGPDGNLGTEDDVKSW